MVIFVLWPPCAAVAAYCELEVCKQSYLHVQPGIKTCGPFAPVMQALGFYLLPRCSSLTSLTITFATVAFTWNFVNTAGNTFILWINREQQV